MTSIKMRRTNVRSMERRNFANKVEAEGRVMRRFLLKAPVSQRGFPFQLTVQAFEHLDSSKYNQREPSSLLLFLEIGNYPNVSR